MVLLRAVYRSEGWLSADPIHALAQFVAELHAPNGSVAVDGFYK